MNRKATDLLGPRHRLAPAASALALIVLLGLLVLDLRERAAVDELAANVRAIRAAVAQQQEVSGSWFPERWSRRRDGSPGVMELYPDVFAAEPPEYPGLDPAQFGHDANHGIVLQLVRFEAERDLGAGPGLLRPPLREGEPYLRFLLDYGPTLPRERALMQELIARLGAEHFTRVEDHLYAMDLRDAP